MTTNIVDNAEQNYELYTSQASTVSRALGITAIGIVWLFGGGLLPKDATPEMLLDRVRRSHTLYAALVLAIVSLAFDVLQYAWASLAWGAFHRAVDIIDVDDGSTPISDARAKAWKRARHLGIVGRLERASGLTGTGNFGARRDAVRLALNPAAGQPRDEGLQMLLDRAAAPPPIKGLTALLFGLKLAALTACYCCIATFVA